jgi:hypothetical protein
LRVMVGTWTMGVASNIFIVLIRGDKSILRVTRSRKILLECQNQLVDGINFRQ